MPTTHYLAFDLGAESGRTVLGTLDSGRLSLEVTHRWPSANTRLNGTLCWDLPAIWDGMKTGLRRSAGPDAARPVRLSGIGVDTWGVDFAFLDGDDQLLGLPVHYRDNRTVGGLERAFARVSRERIFDATGIQFMELNTLYQMAFLAEHRKATLANARTMLFMPDLLHWLLSGKKASEFSIVSTSQMWDPRKDAWARDVLAPLGIPTHLFAPVVPSGTVLGALQGDVASECGVEACPVITPASHDTASAVAAVPAEGDGWCYISSGTWSLVGVELPRPLINAEVAKLNFTNEGGVNGTTRFLKNIAGLWLVQECRREWIRQGREQSYAELTALAAQAKPFAAVLDPDHPPLQRPGEMPQKIADYCRQTGQTPPGSAGAFVRLCLESLAMTYRRRIDHLESLLGTRIHTVHIVGGGCQNEMLNQLTADATGRTVLAGPVEATAAGNVLVQAIAAGSLKSIGEARQVVRDSFPLKKYEPQPAASWDAAYQEYLGLVKA